MHIFGKRVIKTVIAVVACLLIYILLMFLDKALGVDRNTCAIAPTNWYTPFFATIATVYAMQNNPHGSYAQAKIRSFGSIIGGTFGAIIIYFYELIYSKIVNVSDPWTLSNDILFKSIEFIVTTFGIFFLIPITVKLKNKNAVFISCLTYLSVTISIRNGGMNVFLFGFNRIISTIIGVLISLYINTYPHIKKRNKNILFISTLENSFFREDKISDYTKYMMNSFSYKGAKYTLMTTKTILDLNNKFNGVKVDIPLITFNGSCLYHDTDNKYEVLNEINTTDKKEILNVLNSKNMSFFTYCVDRNVLHCYYNKTDTEGSKLYFDSKVNQSSFALESAIPTENVSSLMILLLEKENVIDDIISSLNLKSCELVKYKYFKDKDYYALIIQPKDINKLNATRIIEEREKTEYTVAILNGKTDLCFINNVDFTLCLDSAISEIKERVDYVLDSTNSDDILRFIEKVFKKRNYQEYLNSLKRISN